MEFKALGAEMEKLFGSKALGVDKVGSGFGKEKAVPTTLPGEMLAQIALLEAQLALQVPLQVKEQLRFQVALQEVPLGLETLQIGLGFGMGTLQVRETLVEQEAKQLMVLEIPQEALGQELLQVLELQVEVANLALLQEAQQALKAETQEGRVELGSGFGEETLTRYNGSKQKVIRTRSLICL